MSRRKKRKKKINIGLAVFVGLITFACYILCGAVCAVVAVVWLIVLIIVEVIKKGYQKKLAVKAEKERKALAAKVEEERKEFERKRWEIQKNFAVIDQMDGHEFEWFVAKVLAKIGFQNVQVTKASGDYGVDIIAYDNGVKCAFQCKRYTGTLGLKPIQEVSAGARYYGASVAYAVTNSHFSENARNLADRLGVKLWDRNGLNIIINKINEIERKEREEKDETGISN